jgi:hypothetical protein
MSLAERSRTIQRVCFDLEPCEEDLSALGSAERWLIYRSMVRKRLVDVVSNALPRSKHALGTEAFLDHIAQWLAATGGPKTNLFRRVPNDFVDFALPRWDQAAHAWLSDLAQYEIARWDVKYGPSEHPAIVDFDFELAPVLTPSLRVLQLAYPVHEESSSKPQSREETWLCVYRNEQHEVVVWKLNALAASLVRAWIPGDQSMTQSVHRVAAEHGTEIGTDFVAKLSEMLADFIERGILLGSRAPR